MRRALLLGLGAVSVLLLLLVVLITIVFTTETGLLFAWQRVTGTAVPGLYAKSVSGRLGGSMQLRGIRYRTDVFELRADEARLVWNPGALLAARLQVVQLEARGVRYEQYGKTEPEGDALVLPERINIPLDVELQELHIQDVNVLTGAASEPVIIHDARLRAEINGTHLRIQDIALSSPHLQLQGAARLEAAGDYPVEGDFTWTASPPGFAGLDARTWLAGSLQDLVLKLDLQPPYTANAETRLTDLFAGPGISSSLNLRVSSLAEIHTDWPALPVEADMRVDGSPDRLRLEANIRSDLPATGPLEGSLGAFLHPGFMQLEALKLGTKDSNAHIYAEGRIGFDTPHPVVDLQLDWNDLAWPMQGEPEALSRQGTLTVKGVLDAYEVAGSARFDLAGYTDGRISLNGQGNGQALGISRFGIEALGGALDGSGQLSWEQGLAAGVEVDGSSLDPGDLWPEWPGAIDLQAKAEFSSRDETWRLGFDRVRVDGELRDIPVQLEARGSYQPGQLVLEDSRLVSGSTRMHVTGEAGTTYDLAWELDSPDLASLLPTASGRLSGSGGLRGKPAGLYLTARLAGKGLQYEDHRIDTLDLNASLDMSGQERSRIKLTQEGSNLGGVNLISLQLQGDGYPQSHRLELVTDTDRDRLDLAVEGSWSASDWDYRLTRATLALHRPESLWQLVRPVSGRVSSSRAILPETCWRSGGAVTCLRAERSEEEMTAGFRMESLLLEDLVGLLAEDLSITGTLSGEGTYRERKGQPLHATVRLDTTTGQVASVEKGGEPRQLISFSAGKALLEINNNRARFEARLPLEQGAGDLGARADIGASGRPWAERKIQGEVSVDLPDISFAGQLTPEVSNLRGTVAGRMQLSGSPRAPRLLGTLALTDAGMDLVTPGLTLAEVSLEIAGEDTGEIRIDARARSGEGILALGGRVDLTGTEPEARLQLGGEDIEVLNTPEAEILASPELELVLSGRRVDLTGEIRIPYARIQPRKLPASTLTVSPDQIIIDRERPRARPDFYEIYTRVRFTLGDDVFFDGLGLQGQLKGGLLAISEPGRPARATGELSIADGKYRAYGQDLTIRTGRLLFAGGPVTEPGLDIEAVRRPAPDILVGARVRGSLLVPRFSVFSEPPMPHSQHLSWLVLGRPLERGTSDEERSAMNEAALMLGVTGSDLFGQQIGDSIGVDELKISSESDSATTQASLLVGKYLTPELFVSYGIGIFEPVSTLRLRYTLSSRWKLIGEASALSSAADLFYVIERGE